MANARMTVGSVLETVASSANAVTSIVSTVTNSVEMLNNFVSSARKSQENSLVIQEAEALDRLLTETAEEATKRTERINDYLDAKPGRADIYNGNYQRLAALFAKPDLQAA